MRFSRFFLAALCTAFACAPPLAFAQATAPELPRATVSTAMPATTRVLSVAMGGNLQAALDSAKAGDAIELACGATFSGHFWLPVSSGTGWVVVRPACHTQLPSAGTRMSPATAASLRLPKIVTPDYQAAIATQPGAHHYRVVGVEVTVAPAQPFNYGLVLLGGGNCGEERQCAPADIPHDLVLDRVYVHGADTTSLKRCVALNSASTAIIDSYLSECHGEGQDAQAIGGWNGPGPFKIVNNYLEGAAENILFGGADPSIPNLIPSDIEIRRNHITKPTNWHGGRWLIKNLLELKNAQRVLVEGNVFENNWQHGQEGAAIVLWSVNQGGRATWDVMQDITFRRNLIRNVGAGVQLTGTSGYPSIPTQRVAITDNLVYGIDQPGFEGNGRGFQVGGGLGSLTDLTIARNTVLGSTLTAVTFTGPPTIRMVATGNILEGGAYGIIGDNSGAGTSAFAAFAPGAVFTGNVLRINAEYAYLFPTGNAYPPALDSIGFVNAAGGDFRLTATSPYRGLGAPVDSVLVATAGVVSGSLAPTPTPVPTPVVPALTLDQLRAAITALDKVVGPTGRESKAIKTALLPVDTYLKALLLAVPSSSPTSKVQP